MMKALMAIFPCFFLLSCAGLPGQAPDISECAQGDLACIDRILDATRKDRIKTSEMYPFMRGYEPASLVELKKRGRLKVYDMKPLGFFSVFLSGGTYSYAKIWPAKYGDIYRAEIHYPPYLPGSNLLYMHEAMHVQGLSGGWFHGVGVYTEQQERIMEREGCDKWIETQFYSSLSSNYKWYN